MYTHILHPTDLTKEHYPLTVQAVALAKQLKAKIYLLHVIEVPASIQVAQSLGFTELANPATDDAKTVMSLIGDELDIPADDQFIEVGSVKEHIFNKIRDLNCQLVIVGSHSPGSMPSFLGSTAHAVVNHAPCDVLTLRV